MKKLNSTHVASVQRKSDIIHAALACFSELGFTDTSMIDICVRANASTGSVYHHFKSKEQLAAAVYLDGISTYQSGLLATLENEKDARKGVSSVIEYHLRWVIANPAWAQFLFQERHSSFFVIEAEDTLLSLNAEFVQRISNWFRPHMAEGTVRTLAWDVLFSLLFGPSQQYTMLFLSRKTLTSIDEAISDLSLTVWRSLSKEN